MSKIYLEWVDKAEGDYHTALREYRVRKHPNYDAVCFHAQQCVEKYFKAFLQKEGVYFPKTHDLNVLLDLILPYHSMMEIYRNQLKALNGYSVMVRYPGEASTKEEAKEVITIMKQVRKKLRELLNLE